MNNPEPETTVANHHNESTPLRLRPATLADADALYQLIALSARTLGARYYSAPQIEQALAQGVLGLDYQLISDQTFFIVEDNHRIAGCGGWSKRRTLFGAGASGADSGIDPPLLDASVDAARVRAFFVDPDYARRGIGRMILQACEQAALADGFTHLTLVATLSGQPLYASLGFTPSETIDIELSGCKPMGSVRMEKPIGRRLIRR